MSCTMHTVKYVARRISIHTYSGGRGTQGVVVGFTD